MKKYILLLAITLVSVHTWAQENRTKTLINAALHGWEYELKAGFNIGGTLPLPFPEEIRNIKSYNPTLSITIEGNMTKWLGEQKRWGVVTGLRLENKGMRTKAEVKNYGMEIIGEDGNRLKGNWTGGVRTKVQNSYLTIPILAAYKLNQRSLRIDHREPFFIQRQPVTPVPAVGGEGAAFSGSVVHAGDRSVKRGEIPGVGKRIVADKRGHGGFEHKRIFPEILKREGARWVRNHSGFVCRDSAVPPFDADSGHRFAFRVFV